MSDITVKLKRVRQEEKPQIPAYATPGSAGVDLCACLEKDLVIQPGEVAKVPTGLAMELPGPGVVALVFARSGLAARHGVTLANSVGVIDSDYRGEVQVLLINQGPKPFVVSHGDRIGQMLFLPVFKAEFTEAETLSDTVRGEGGFGSTGTR